MSLIVALLLLAVVLGVAVVRLKEGELKRYQSEEQDSPEATGWEQREYFDLF